MFSFQSGWGRTQECKNSNGNSKGDRDDDKDEDEINEEDIDNSNKKEIH